MRVVVQRVSEASVTVGAREVGRIGPGLLLLVGFTESDGDDELEWVARKIVGLRIFHDAEDRMDLSLADVDGELLAVSQFTLYADTRKGRRPSFVRAAPPQVAEPLYDRFVARLRELSPGPVAEGEFGAMMDVALVNDGPVTLVIEKGGKPE